MNDEKKLKTLTSAKDKDGWVKSDIIKPTAYDLMLLRDDKGKIQSGWWTGQGWDYARKKIGDILHWKRPKEQASKDKFIPKFEE